MKPFLQKAGRWLSRLNPTIEQAYDVRTDFYLDKDRPSTRISQHHQGSVTIEVRKLLLTMLVLSGMFTVFSALLKR
ncbi:MAG: hypothetical protein WDA00_03180 [Eubacteriales bacterium]